MNIQEQQKVADVVLSLLETLDPKAVLAGGAPRDWYFGKEATDLDFYLNINMLPVEFEDVLSDFGVTELTEKHGYFYDNRNPFLLYVLDGKFLDCKVQFMIISYTSPILHVLNCFALDICQAWYKHGKLSASKKFMECEPTKTIHIVNHLYGMGDEYVQKIQSKFPDYKLVNDYA